MQIVETGFAMERIAMDILCELPETSGGNKHILVISDYYAKWTEYFAMPNMEAKKVAKLLVEDVIVIFGTHTDQGYSSKATCFRRCVDYCKYRKLGLLPTILSQMGWSSGIIEQYLRCCPHCQ